MSLFDNPDHLHLLKNLLYPTERRDYDAFSDSEEDVPMASNNLTPGSIGPPGAPRSKGDANKKNSLIAPLLDKEDDLDKKQPKTIEEWQAMQEKQDQDILDSRKVPEYSMHYRQAVGTEDVFLQMGNRTGATSSCEDLIIEVKLYEETVSADKMNLAIKEREIDLSTPVYHLKLPIAHPVNVDRCSAKYDADSKTMNLTLRLNRELDFANF